MNGNTKCYSGQNDPPNVDWFVELDKYIVCYGFYFYFYVWIPLSQAYIG